MRVPSTLLILTTTACTAARSISGCGASESGSGRYRDSRDLGVRLELPAHGDSIGRGCRSVQSRRGEVVKAFFDEDVASDEDWTRFTNKGGALMCGLKGNDEVAGRQMGDKRTPPSAASPWTGNLKDELATWQWTETNPASYTCKMDEHWDISGALKALNLNGKPQSEGGDNVCHRIEHWNPSATKGGRRVPAINQWYNVEDIAYQATEAHYEFAINAPGGAIYGLLLESPLHSASRVWHSDRKPADQSKLPALRAFSDILWGYWVRAAPDVRAIRYFFMLGIANDETNALIARCLRNAGKELTDWPGVEFKAEMEEGHALVGSPNGAAFAYFLMQHKRELGEKTISKVTVFREESGDDVGLVDAHLVFYVEDVREGTGEDDENEGPMERGEMKVTLKL